MKNVNVVEILLFNIYKSSDFFLFESRRWEKSECSL